MKSSHGSAGIMIFAIERESKIQMKEISEENMNFKVKIDSEYFEFSFFF